MIQISQLIRDLRKKRGFTQERLAELVHCSLVHIGRIETGKNKPSFELFEKILSALSVGADDFFEVLGEMADDKESNELISQLSHKLRSLPKERIKTISKMVDILKEEFDHQNSPKSRQ